MSAIQSAVKGATQVPKSIARHASIEEVFKVHDVLAPKIPDHFRDGFNKLSTDNTFFIKAPNIPVLRHLVLWFKNLRLERFARKQKLSHIAVIRQYGEKATERVSSFFERAGKFFKENNADAYQTWRKLGVVEKYDNKHVVVFEPIRK